MRLLTVISPKGGVGKTTVTANLATALAQLGANVTILDLDPQNALRLHFGMAHDDPEGIAGIAQIAQSWRKVMFESAYKVKFLPYGNVDEQQRLNFEHIIKTEPDWLFRQLSGLALADDSIVMIDTPPGPSLYLQRVLELVHLALVVLKPDAASYSTIPAMENLVQFYCAHRQDFLGYSYLLNQMDATKQLSRDVYSMLKNNLEQHFVPVTIHRDEAVSEALACQMPVAFYSQHCSATHDVRQVAEWLDNNYGLLG